MKLRFAIGGLAASGAAAFALSAIPALGNPGGSIAATVTVSAPCITLGTNAIDFGTHNFSTNSVDSFTNKFVNPTYTDCSPSSENVFVHGSDATGGGGAAWTLRDGGINTCPFGTNVYTSEIEDNLLNIIQVSTVDRTLATTTAGGSAAFIFILHMPCSGSSGAGQLMSFTYTLTASF